MSLKITTEPQENRQLQVVVEVDQPRVDEQLKRAARKLARDYRIPGFRKGKAPYNIIAQYLGEGALYNEIIEDLGQAVYRDAIEQEEIDPYAQGSLVDVALNPMTYTFLVPLEPVVDLGDYRTLRVEEDSTEISEEAINARLDAYREEYAGWQDVDRPSKYGDLLNIDVKSVIPAGEEGGEETVVLDETDWDVTPDQENPMEPAGFDEALLGMTPGEEKDFDLSWPEDSQSIYAGKTATFHVKLNNIQAYEQPELNDEFAQLVGPDYETLNDLIDSIRDTLREEAEQDAENAYINKVSLDAALEQAELDYPPVVVEDQIDSMVADFAQRLRQFGINDIEGYFEQTGQSLDDYRESLREQAVIIAERNLIISELWKLEQIEIEEEDIEAKINEILGITDEDEEELEEAEEVEEVEEADVDATLRKRQTTTMMTMMTTTMMTMTTTTMTMTTTMMMTMTTMMMTTTAKPPCASKTICSPKCCAPVPVVDSRGSDSQEKTFERLPAIARGEDVPELKPQPDGDDEEANRRADDAEARRCRGKRRIADGTTQSPPEPRAALTQRKCASGVRLQSCMYHQSIVDPRQNRRHTQNNLQPRYARWISVVVATANCTQNKKGAP
ncbi:MAG: trigger factor [Caldilineaceae bacterium]